MSAGSSAAAGAASGAWAGVPGAAIGAATGLGSALIGKHAQKNATKAQTEAGNQALALEQANLAEQKRQFDVQQAAAKAEYDRQAALQEASRARRAPFQALSQGIAAQTAKRLGLGNLGSYNTTPSAASAPGLALATSKAAPMTFANLGSYGPVGTPEEEVPERSFRTLDNWNAWGTR